MSTLKSINVIHPSSAVNNIVNDASGNVAVGNNLTVAGTATLTGATTVGGVAVVAVAPGTNGNVLTSNGTAWTSATPASPVPTPSAIGQIPFSTNGSTYAATQKIVQGTAVASTSGTSIDFTSIPSWVKRITVMFNGVSTNGTSLPLIQLGDSGGIEATGYNGDSVQIHTGSSGSAISTGFSIFTNAATNVLYGQATISYFGSNTWICSFVGGTTGNPLVLATGGAKTLSDVLTQIRITTVNGTDTFDAGSINIMYE